MAFIDILKGNSWKGVLFHLTLAILLSIGLFYYTFYVWMPGYTNHNQHVEVPILEKLEVNEAKAILESKGLRLEVQDTTYNSRYEPGVIIRQEPAAASEVKENRRIYVSVNTMNVPLVTLKSNDVKKLINTNISTVESEAYRLKLKIGEPTMKCGKYSAKGYVESISYDGKALEAGMKVPVGSELDVVVWNGRVCN